MKNLILFGLLSVFLFSCKKESFFEKTDKPSDFEHYTIQKGNHYSDKSVVKIFKDEQLTYSVKFDSSAIYTTEHKTNQLDINKLFGFSDNSATHHEFSARFGWRWSDNALRLFAYTYNNGNRAFTELQKIEIGKEYTCSIVVRQKEYGFIINGRQTVMPRESTTETADGYLLWPYFGGDEKAPHSITILMKKS